jgi:hypothetical protein
LVVKIDTKEPMFYGEQHVRYVGRGIKAWPIVVELKTKDGARTCIREFDERGRPRDPTDELRLAFVECVEPEDWS